MFDLLKRLDPFRRPRAPQFNEEEFARNETLREAWRRFEGSAGWGLLKEEISTELRGVLGVMAGTTLDEAAYARLAGRVEVLLWLGGLPGNRLAHYTQLSAETKPQAVIPERDGPVQWDDV